MSYYPYGHYSSYLDSRYGLYPYSRYGYDAPYYSRYSSVYDSPYYRSAYDSPYYRSAYYDPLPVRNSIAYEPLPVALPSRAYDPYYGYDSAYYRSRYLDAPYYSAYHRYPYTSRYYSPYRYW